MGMTAEDTAGDVDSGEASGFGYEGSESENNGDTSNKKADVITLVIGKRNVVLFTLSHILCDLNALHQTEFTYQVHF